VKFKGIKKICESSKCGKIYDPNHVNQKYCSPRCTSREANRRWREKHPEWIEENKKKNRGKRNAYYARWRKNLSPERYERLKKMWRDNINKRRADPEYRAALYARRKEKRKDPKVRAEDSARAKRWRLANPERAKILGLRNRAKAREKRFKEKFGDNRSRVCFNCGVHFEITTIRSSMFVEKYELCSDKCIEEYSKKCEERVIKTPHDYRVSKKLMYFKRKFIFKLRGRLRKGKTKEEITHKYYNTFLDQEKIDRYMFDAWLEEAVQKVEYNGRAINV